MITTASYARSSVCGNGRIWNFRGSCKLSSKDPWGNLLLFLPRPSSGHRVRHYFAKKGVTTLNGLFHKAWWQGVRRCLFPPCYKTTSANETAIFWRRFLKSVGHRAAIQNPTLLLRFDSWSIQQPACVNFLDQASQADLCK